MWEQVSDFTNTYLNIIGIWLGILLTIPVFLTWWEVTIGKKRRRVRWFKEIQSNAGERPAILILNLMREDKSITPAVEKFRQGEKKLKGIPKERIFEIKFGDGNITREDIPKIVKDIRDRAADISHTGADVVHLFFGGPAILATHVGREFANSCRVDLYQYASGTYVNWGPLNHDTFEV